MNEAELMNKLSKMIIAPRFLSASSVAKMLDCSVRTVRERYSLTSGFPEPHYLPEGVKGRPAKRWKESDVIDWMNSNKITADAAN